MTIHNVIIIKINDLIKNKANTRMSITEIKREVCPLESSEVPHYIYMMIKLSIYLSTCLIFLNALIIKLNVINWYVQHKFPEVVSEP